MKTSQGKTRRWSTSTASEPTRLRGRKLQVRRLKLWTANPYCAMCGRLTDYPDGFELDHKIALTNGGEDTEDNCQILCIADHDTKTRTDLGHREVRQVGPDGWPMGAGESPSN